MKKIIATTAFAALSTSIMAADLTPSCIELQKKLDELYQQLPAEQVEQIKAVYAVSFDALSKQPREVQAQSCKDQIQALTEDSFTDDEAGDDE